jgi:hypothetical protein
MRRGLPSSTSRRVPTPRAFGPPPLLAARRGIIHFTEQSPVLSRICAARNYKANIWIEEFDRGALHKRGFALRAGEKPTLTTVLKRQLYYNLDQLTTRRKPFDAATPHDLATGKPIGGEIGAKLFQALETLGHSSHWWASTSSTMGSALVDNKTRPTIVISERVTPLYHLEQFQNSDELRRSALITANKNLAMLWGDKVERSYAPLLTAMAERGYSTGYYLQPRTLQAQGLELKAGAQPAFTTPTETQRDALTVYNVDELEKGYEFAKSHGTRLDVDRHTDLVTGRELPFPDEALGDEAFSFPSRLWVFKRDLVTSLYPDGAALKPGVKGRLYLPREWCTRYGLTMWNADECTDPKRAFAVAGLVDSTALWATKSGGPPAHLQSLLDVPPREYSGDAAFLLDPAATHADVPEAHEALLAEAAVA